MAPVSVSNNKYSNDNKKCYRSLNNSETILKTRGLHISDSTVVKHLVNTSQSVVRLSVRRVRLDLGQRVNSLGTLSWMDVQENGITARLGWADYVVIGVMLMISASIGLYYRFTGGKQKSAEEFFSADRSMSAGPLSFALMVSFMSAITMLGYSAEYYVYGSQLIGLYLGVGLGTPVALYLYLPIFFKLQKISVYEYLEMRFGIVARLVASISNSIQLILYTGVVLYAPALALEATTGISEGLSILLIGLICIFYSAAGGIKAVLVTDLFQGALMLLAVVLVIIVGVMNVEGGIAGIWQLALDGDRIEFDNFSVDPTMRHTWWNLTIGGFFTFTTMFAVNQVQIQRLLTVRTLREAQLASWGSLPFMTFFGVTTFLAGLSIYAYYKDCDPVTAGYISSTDMLMPYFIMQTVSHIPGLPGFFIAGIFSATLSTVSGILNSLAAVILEDYIKPVYVMMGSEFPEKRGSLVGKLLAIVVGVLCIMVAYLAKYMGGLIQAGLSINGAIGGPVLGLFTLGMFFESTEEKGAVISTLSSLALICWCAFGQPRPSRIPLPVSTNGCNVTLATTTLSSPRQLVIGDSSDFYLYRISYMWYAPLGFVVTVIVGLAVSNLLQVLTKEVPPQLNPDLFTPMVENRIRKRLDAVNTMGCQNSAFDSEPDTLQLK